MAHRIVLFGATGFTGRLTAEALVALGESPLLVGRDPAKLHSLADRLDAGCETAVAGADSSAPLRKLLEENDVLISTVGPFAKWGDAAVSAAIAAGVPYLDSTGEPVFMRKIFDDYGPMASEAGCPLLTAFGFDYVPGNLAAALCLQDAGDEASEVASVDVGYFITGDAGTAGVSGGTAASLSGAAFAPGFAWRHGALTTVPNADASTAFRVDGSERWGIAVSGTEHYGIPKLAGNVRDVGVYVGVQGKASRHVTKLSSVTPLLAKVPGVANIAERLAARVQKPGDGPTAEIRARQGSRVVALARDEAGRTIAEVCLHGADPYDLTARFLAWGAVRAGAGGIDGTGALTPVRAFGLDTLEKACADAGLTRDSHR